MRIPEPTKEAYDLFHRGSIALSKMEHNGIKIDVPFLEKSIKQVSQKMQTLKEDLKKDEIWLSWERRFGSKANLGSLPQLSEVLFGVLKYPYEGELTKTGRWRADEDLLNTLNIGFVKGYLEHNKLRKLKSTYLEGTLREVIDGYVHPVVNLHLVKTTRSSCDHPNWQNIPARTPEYSRYIRQAVIPRRGRVLVESDFSALEFKIAACVWRDLQMIAYASDPTKDIHRDMASKCYLVETKDVSKDCRYCAKNGFVFPLIYGSYYRKIARNLWNMITDKKLMVGSGDSAVKMRKHLRQQGIRELGRCEPGAQYDPVPGTFEHHIKNVEEWFWNEFHVFRDKKKEWIEEYRKRGWFKMVTGFVVNGLYTNNFLLNAPIQGPGFHCLAWTVIRLQEEIERRQMKTLLIAEIHDCVLADVPESELQDYLYLVKRIVSEELPKAWDWICVPLEIEAEVARTNWYEKVAWAEKDGKWGPK